MKSDMPNALAYFIIYEGIRLLSKYAVDFDQHEEALNLQTWLAAPAKWRW